MSWQVRDNWVDVGNPIPRETAIPYEPVAWPVQGILPLSDQCVPTTTNSFFNILQSRRSRRNLKGVQPIDLSVLLSSVYRIQMWGDKCLGFHTTQRPVPSAGAIHPVHVLISSYCDMHWMRYSPECHVFELLAIESLEPAGIRRHLQTPPVEGTLIWFVGEPGKTGAKYERPSSLVWRDAGHLQAMFGLAAHALGLGFHSLGHTGNVWAEKIDAEQRLVGLGMAVVGKIK